MRFDKFVSDVRQKRLYGDVEWTHHVDGKPDETKKGAWLLADGGYHRWTCIQCPDRWDTARSVLSWSKWLESVRKDVECIFGRLKGRFRCLKIPSLFQGDASKVANQFRACCAPHNLLHELDGRGAEFRFQAIIDEFAKKPTSTIPGPEYVRPLDKVSAGSCTPTLLIVGVRIVY